MARRKEAVKSWFEELEVEEVTCPLCERPIPESQRSEHHMVPKCRGGRETTTIHAICHKQIHALFTESELARSYSTAADLLAHPEMAKFIAWVRKKDPGFTDGAKRSNRRR